MPPACRLPGRRPRWSGPEKLAQIWAWSRSGAGPFDEPPPAGGPEVPTAPAADATATAAASPSPSEPVASPSAPAPEGPAAPALDWRRLLDYLDQASGASLGPIWERWVVTPDQARLLVQREVALADYRRTAALAGAWQMPPDVRLAMTTWQFGPARDLLAQAREVLTARTRIEAAAPVELTVPPPTLRLAFEEVATGAAEAEASRELAALDQIAAARQARTSNDGAARIVGLLGSDPDAQLAQAREAFARGDLDKAVRLAAAARSAWTGAAGAGQTRLIGGAISLVGLLLLGLCLYWRSAAARRREMG